MDDDKALQMGKTSTAGSFYLLIGIVVSSILLALGTLALNSVFTLDEVAWYGIVLLPSNIIAYFRDLGVNSAMTQRIAKLRADNKHSEIRDVIFSGIIFQIISGALLALLCFVIASPVATVLGRPHLSPLIGLMSLSIFASSIVSAASAIFVGFEKMKLNSFTQILQAVIKTICGPLLVVLGYSVLGAVIGAISSVVVSGLISILLVYFVLFRPLCKEKIAVRNIKQTLFPMLSYGIPLTFSGIVIGVLPQIFTFFMGMYAGDSIMANYFAAIYFAVLVTFISFPISTVLFPAFSKLNPEKEPELVKTVFSSSVKYTSILIVPTVMLIIALSTPLIHTLFPEGGILSALLTFPEGSMIPAMFTTITEPKFAVAPLFLAIGSIVNLFVLFGSVSLSSFQTGIGKTKQIMKQSLLSLAISLPFSYGLIRYFASLGGETGDVLVVIGGILAVMVSTIPGLIWGLIWAWKNYRVKADFKNSGKIFTAALFASFVAYIFTVAFTIPYAILLFVGAIIFLLVYLIVAPLIGAVNSTDIDNLKMMSSGLGPISKIVAIPLLFMRKLCKNSKTK
ncbi:MAG: oligosaccharide flippase family protein [Candidatus Bathyarchaeota archaeon]|nr:oligosaccharide flippase family protein [Candidatus Termiticorpusculum sp.]